MNTETWAGSGPYLALLDRALTLDDTARYLVLARLAATAPDMLDDALTSVEAYRRGDES